MNWVEYISLCLNAIGQNLKSRSIIQNVRKSSNFRIIRDTEIPCYYTSVSLSLIMGFNKLPTIYAEFSKFSQVFPNDLKSE